MAELWGRVIGTHIVGHASESGVQTKGGEALTQTGDAKPARWHVLWTHSNCEQLVHDQLAAKGFDLFLPTVESWVRRAGTRRRERVPLFRSYLFLRHAVDKASYLEVSKARGLVQILGQRWDNLETVPNTDIDAVRRFVLSGLPIFPHPYLREGQRVRITHGPLADVEGILVRGNAKTGVLVVSVDLVCRSIAVHLDCTQLEAA